MQQELPQGVAGVIRAPQKNPFQDSNYTGTCPNMHSNKQIIMIHPKETRHVNLTDPLQ